MSQTVTKIGADGQQVTTPVSQSVSVTTESVAAAAAAAKPVRPEWCPEKFWNAETGAVNTEGLAKSYVELEKRPSVKPADASANTQQAEKAGEQQQQQAVDPNATPSQAQAIEKARSSYATKGTLDDADYAELAKAGYDKSTVDTYLAGIKAQEQTIYAEAYNVVGGQENYSAMIQWASANLTEAEIEDFDARVGNPKTLMGAVRELAARQKASIGTDGKKTAASTANASTAVEPYKSKAEMMAAVKSADYKTSESFRRQHGLRILASEKANINLWV